MILYTMMPQELIFPPDEQIYSKQQMVQYEGIDMVVEPCEEHGYTVVRILSSNPQHYLQYQPGQRVWIH